MFRVRSRHYRRTAQAESLRGQQYIDVEGCGVRCWPASSSGLGPQFRRKVKSIIGEWDVPVGGGVHECVQASNPNDLIRPQQFALDFVIHDCRHENASARTETVLQPIRYCDDFLAALWLSDEAERPRIKQKNVAHG